jgi:hypothetical protein
VEDYDGFDPQLQRTAPSMRSPDLLITLPGSTGKAQVLDDEILKSKFSHWFDYTSAPSGPIKEMSTDDSSKLVLLKSDDGEIDQLYTKVVPGSLIEDKMQSKIEVLIEGDKDIEDHVTQWQEFTTIKQGQEHGPRQQGISEHSSRHR